MNFVDVESSSSDLRIQTIARYPVKSMKGQSLISAEVTPVGLKGDREYALVDSETSKVVSAKNPKKWSKMLDCRAELLGDNGSTLRITWPGNDGVKVTPGSFEEIEGHLSSFLGRGVRLSSVSNKPQKVVFEELHADLPEDARRNQVTDIVKSPERTSGPFFDAASIHLLTTTTLESLAQIYPQGNFSPARFRPNLVIRSDGMAGFPEKEWVGRTLVVGNSVRLKVYAQCGRCIMTTLPQDRLPQDAGVLSTAVRRTGGKVGAYALVLQGGTIRVDDTVHLLP